jgi:hypothetical protein
MSSPSIHFDEEFLMPTPDAQRRLEKFMEARQVCQNADFNGLVLMSLMCYVSDQIWQESIDDALRTLSGGHA